MSSVARRTLKLPISSLVKQRALFNQKSQGIPAFTMDRQAKILFDKLKDPNSNSSIPKKGQHTDNNNQETELDKVNNHAKTANLVVKSISDNDYLDLVILGIKNEYPRLANSLDKLSTTIKAYKNLQKFANFILFLAVYSNSKGPGQNIETLEIALNEFVKIMSHHGGTRKMKKRRTEKHKKNKTYKK